MAEKPTGAFVLSIIAGIIGLIYGIVILAAASVAAALVSGLLPIAGGVLIALGVWWLIAAILILVGASWINSGVPGKVKNGGILVLVFSILSLPNWLTFILGLIGGILALVWKPPAKPVQETVQPSETSQQTSSEVV